MLKVECYKCTVCGSLHENFETAQQCETSHSYPTSMEVIDCIHSTPNTMFPNKIMVSLKNKSGNVAEYHFVQSNCE